MRHIVFFATGNIITYTHFYMNDCYKGKVIAYPKEKTEIRFKELGGQAIVIEK